MTPAVEPTWIVEIALPREKALALQNLLEAEEGLAVMRCMGGDNTRQQLWTTPSQLEELLCWLEGLPDAMECRVLDSRIWAGRA